jgi:hypothetical protein
MDAGLRPDWARTDCHAAGDLIQDLDRAVHIAAVHRLSGTTVKCHTVGDRCDLARAEMLAGLMRLDTANSNEHKAPGVSESSGMEVSQARLEEDQALDAATKARVTIHSFRKELVNQDIKVGLKIAQKNLQAGNNALRSATVAAVVWDWRRSSS